VDRWRSGRSTPRTRATPSAGPWRPSSRRGLRGSPPAGRSAWSSSPAPETRRSAPAPTSRLAGCASRGAPLPRGAASNPPGSRGVQRNLHRRDQRLGPRRRHRAGAGVRPAHRRTRGRARSHRGEAGHHPRRRGYPAAVPPHRARTRQGPHPHRTTPELRRGLRHRARPAPGARGTPAGGRPRGRRADRRQRPTGVAAAKRAVDRGLDLASTPASAWSWRSTRRSSARRTASRVASLRRKRRPV
jgi:hypothetical protein